jgi:hypothetical protein
MSSSQYIARLQPTGMGTFYFARWETDSGHVPTVAQMLQDRLVTPGVDGIRYLDNHREPQVFQAATWEDFGSLSLASQQATNYELSRSLLGALAVTYDGISTLLTVKIIDVRSPGGGKPRPRGGSLVGFGASAVSKAYVDAIWTMHVAF